ncbi:MAG: VWA domain-containing protein [Gemmatimonadaceae bacterium]|nr:VWA domain-containing protein [Gemmatimonadaceae bacterium]
MMDRIAAWWDALGIALGVPWALLALLVLPLVWWLRRKAAADALPFAAMDVVLEAAPRPSRVRRWLVRIRLVALAACVLALAHPFSRGGAGRQTKDGIDIMLAFDISSSMLAEDFQPQNRLEVARAQVKEFVRLRESDRLGVVSFAGEALTQVPLTADHQVVLAAIDQLQPGQLDDGTAIGTAIATASNRLRAASGGSKVLVLLTDGVNNRGQVDPRTAARAAAAFGIRVYAIGVGTEGMAPVPVGRGLFGLRYETQKVEIDDALLTEVARATGGRYFRARDAAGLERVTREIDRLERTPTLARRSLPRSEWYVIPASVALAALLLEAWVLLRRGPLP